MLIGYSIITIEFPENREKYVGWAESASGMGLLFGPAMGAVVYGCFGYIGTFITFGAVLFVNLVMI